MSSKKSVFIKGKEFLLGEFIDSGTEGNIYRLKDHDNLLVKILKKSKLEAENTRKRNHIKKLIERKVNENLTRLKIPKYALDYPDLGYVMSYYDKSMSLSQFIHIDESIENFEDVYVFGELGLKNRIRISAMMFKALHYIHLEGLTFCDISPNNILAKSDSLGIAFIDTDNLIVGNIETPNVLGTPRYMAPEVYNKASKATQESDVFSMAILVFELLTFNHPYVGDDIKEGDPEEEENAYRGLKDYVFKQDTNNFLKNRIFYDVFVTKTLQNLFCRMFVEGLNDKYRRPSSKDFYLELYSILDNLVTCSNCGMIYPNTKHDSCPQCSSKNDIVTVEFYQKICNNGECTEHLVSNKIYDFSKDLINLEFRNMYGRFHEQDAIFASIQVLKDEEQINFYINKKVIKNVQLIDNDTGTVEIRDSHFNFPYKRKYLVLERTEIKEESFNRSVIYYAVIKW